MADSQDTLTRVHELRMQAHWGKKHKPSEATWPQSDKDWRQTPYGAPWDANVHMAQWHLDFARKLRDEGVL